MSEPGVIVHARGEPPASSTLVPARGMASPYIRIQFDRVAFEARDQAAYASVALLVNQAAELAQETFIEPVSLPPARLGLRFA